MFGYTLFIYILAAVADGVALEAVQIGVDVDDIAVRAEFQLCELIARAVQLHYRGVLREVEGCQLVAVTIQDFQLRTVCHVEFRQQVFVAG